MKNKMTTQEFKQYIISEAKKLYQSEIVKESVENNLSLLKEDATSMGFELDPETLKKVRQEMIKKAAGWDFSQPQQLDEFNLGNTINKIGNAIAGGVGGAIKGATAPTPEKHDFSTKDSAGKMLGKTISSAGSNIKNTIKGAVQGVKSGYVGPTQAEIDKANADKKAVAQKAYNNNKRPATTAPTTTPTTPATPAQKLNEKKSK